MGIIWGSIVGGGGVIFLGGNCPGCNWHSGGNCPGGDYPGNIKLTHNDKHLKNVQYFCFT